MNHWHFPVMLLFINLRKLFIFLSSLHSLSFSASDLPQLHEVYFLHPETSHPELFSFSLYSLYNVYPFQSASHLDKINVTMLHSVITHVQASSRNNLTIITKHRVPFFIEIIHVFFPLHRFIHVWF